MAGEASFGGRIEPLLRNRAARIGLATLLIGLGGWAFFPYVAYKVAPAAYLNAELIRITAPISGQITQDLPRKGDPTDSSKKLTLIESTMIDRSGLVALERQFEEAKSKASLASIQIAELTAAGSAFEKRMEGYQAALANRYHSQIAQIRPELLACRDSESVKRKALERAEQMTSRKLISEVQFETVKADYFSTVQICQEINTREQKLIAELDAAKKGIFVQDGTGVPSFTQERSTLLLSRQERERELLAARSKLAELEAQISALRSHADSLTRYETKLPPGHIVWSVLASPGSAVVEGQTIMELADCRNPFLIVQFLERELASIMVGDAADIRLIGETGWKRGRVRRVRGSAARTDETLLAAAAPVPEEHYIAVEIGMPEDAGSVETDRTCNIGRLAEVRLQRHVLTLFGGLFAKQESTSAAGKPDASRSLFLRARLDGAFPPPAGGKHSQTLAGADASSSASAPAGPVPEAEVRSPPAAAEGVLYRLRAGPFDEQASANAVCQKLKAGESRCLVTAP